MGNAASHRLTLGVLSTWSIYEGTTIDRYAQTLFQGISAAAAEHHCHLLLGCGIGLPDSPRASRTAWPVPGPDADFIPVGPWNTDGLIIIPDDLSAVQAHYLQALMTSGFPIVCTTSDMPAPFVAVDNDSGMRQAMDHLLQHGHRQIAFIAGKFGRRGESAERLAVYRASLQAAGLPEDPRLIAYGEHRREAGRAAMDQILRQAVPFTAVLASNDLSALGAIEALEATGRSIPHDVAVMGFDDILDTRSHLPPLSTVRHPTFAIGYQAVELLLEVLAGKTVNPVGRRLPSQLIIRESCGCQFDGGRQRIKHLTSDLLTRRTNLVHAMAEVTLTEARHASLQEIEAQCEQLVGALWAELGGDEPGAFIAALQELAHWIDIAEEDASAWQAAITLLRDHCYLVSGAKPQFLDALLDRARLAIAQQAQRQTTHRLLRQMDVTNRLGLMTSQLLAAGDDPETASILAQHLPWLNIAHAVVVTYSADEQDPVGQGTIVLRVGLQSSQDGGQFAVRQFPPPVLYPQDQVVHLALLPLVINGQAAGFVAFSATNLEPCAAITHNLAALLRTRDLYVQALEGRRLAEDANRVKSRFLSTVSHELRTPLSLIVGLSAMLLREESTASRLSGAARRDLDQIHLSAQHLGRLIGDVLDLTSSEAGQLHLMREPLDLIEVVRVAEVIGAQMAREQGLEWRSHLPDHTVHVIGDRTRLRQVVLNLVSNAVKFTPAGIVVLQVALVNQEAVISISDTGIGVSPCEQETIFGEFQRGEQTIQSGYSGLGLGLAICKQLVEQHGGTLGVRSPGDLGGGTTFFFTLPLRAAITLPGLRDASRTVPEHEGVIVVLTEQEDDSSPLCCYLRECGFDVQQRRADDPELLQSLVAAPAGVLILTDSLAGRRGWAIMELLKRHPATELIPVLVYILDLSGNQGELLELNYLHKPIRPEQLGAELDRYCEVGAAPPARRTILVVDDDPGILELHCRLVEQATHRALRAHNGREAMAILEHAQADLILLDLMMPEMDGFAVLAALRSSEATRNIPVIVVTAQVLTEADIERCNRGVAAVLSKGVFTSTETLERIEAVLTHHHPQGHSAQRLVRRALAFMHTHYAESIEREQIASHAGVTADYLTECFRQELGVSPMAYLNRYRIRQARDLLVNTDRTITDIAGAAGFSEGAHFTRTFQREVGMSPRAYRRGPQGAQKGQEQPHD